MNLHYLRNNGLYVAVSGLVIWLGAQGCVATQNWVDEKLNPLTGRVDKVEGRVTTVEQQASRTDGHVREMGDRLAGVEGGLEDTKAKTSEALTALAGLRLERRLVLHLKDGAGFAFNSASMSESTKREIDGFLSDLRTDLKETDKAIFLVAGHTDSTGPTEYNYELGRRRADSVARHLIINKGVDPTQVMTVSYGESAPLGENATQDGRKKNRRVEILVYRETINSSQQVSAAR